ncbi:hypothetical protein JCM5350_006433 [Sporobolomyces pararoseus]
MHRTIRQGLLIRTIGRRTFKTSSCCLTSGSSSTPYSLPHDAFTSPSSSTTPSSSSYSRSRSPTSSSTTTTTTTTPRISSSSNSQRPRQKQFLTDSEAQAFADLLGQILPNSSKTTTLSSSSKAKSTTGSGGGVFDLFGESQSNEGTKEQGGGIDQIQTALQKKMEKKFSSSSSSILENRRKGIIQSQVAAQERILSPTEELELDRLKEEMFLKKDESQLYFWSLQNIFGITSTSSTASLFVDPTTSFSATTTKIPNPRLYPSLLLNLFLLLRDTFSSPNSALQIFNLACSNPHSYILGCTSKLYLEVLKTRWTLSQGDVEGVLEGFEGMRSGGVRVGIQEEEGFKKLVQEIGECIKVDRERAELVVQSLEQEGFFGTGGLDEREREREVQKRKWFGDKDSVRLWRRMEKILEDHLDEQEELRRERLDERYNNNRMEESRDRGYSNSDEIDFGSREEDSLLGNGKPSLFSHRDSPESTVPSPRTHLHSPTRRSGLSPFENVRPSSNSFRSKREQEEQEEQEWNEFKRDSDYTWKERDRSKGLPKRPSFANPYKIRRQSLLKSEKSRRDEKHPMLFWKQ